MGRLRSPLTLVAGALVLLGLACSLGSDEAKQREPTPTASAERPTRTPVSFLPEPTEAPTEDPGECEPPTPQISLEEPVNAQVPPTDAPDENRLFYCVMVPPQATKAIFELTGTTVPLDLYVGYPDLETVQDGGILFWSDTSGEDGDKEVVVEMVGRDDLFAGPYYIEVSPHDLSESSPFTLLVTVQQAQ